MGSVFGGSKSRSYNKNLRIINEKFSPVADYARTGADSLNQLLSGDASGFNAFKDATGFNAMAKEGSVGVTGNAAARGLLRSGSAGKALTQFGQNLQNQFADSYMNRLLGLAGLGIQSGGLMAQAGQVNKSKSKGGLGGFLGSAASGIAASDRRLKKNVVEVGKLDNGLNLYVYNYIDGRGPFIGVMADEVEKIHPDALGPVIDGYATVEYNKIEEMKAYV